MKYLYDTAQHINYQINIKTRVNKMKQMEHVLNAFISLIRR